MRYGAASDIDRYLASCNSPLLTDTEEKDLAYTIQGKWKKTSEPARYRAMSRDSAVEKMINANLRLVVYIAKNFRYKRIPLMDLIQEGNMELLKAAEGFDPERGAKFSTYAGKCIRGRMISARAENRTIRVTQGMLAHASRWKRAVRELGERLDYPPSIVEIAKEAGVSMQSVPLVLKAVRLYQDTWSLNGSGVYEKVRLPRSEESEPEETVLERERTELLPVALEKLIDDVLSKRDSDILKLRYGLGGGKAHTLKGVGEMINLSRERVRQIEMDSLRKLERALTQDGYQEYLPEILMD